MLESHAEQFGTYAEEIGELSESCHVIKKKLERKANEDELQSAVEYMRTLPQNKDLVSLYKKTIP